MGELQQFVADLLDVPEQVHHRLIPKLHLDPEVEKLRGST